MKPVSSGRPRAAAAVWLPRCAFVASMVLTACGGGGGGAGSGETAGPGAPEVPQANYLPLAPGNHWSFINPAAIADGEVSHHAIHVQSAATASGRNGFRVQVFGYDLNAETQVVEAGESIIVVDSTGATEHPLPSASAVVKAIGPIQLYRLPLRVGDSHVQYDKTLDGLVDLDGDGRLDGIHARSTVTVVGLESVTVPAGTFDGVLHLRTVIEQRFSFSSLGRSTTVVTTSDDWLAPDVGPVRAESRFQLEDGTGDSPSVRLLESYGVGTRRSDSLPPTVESVSPLASSDNRPVSQVVVVTSEHVDLAAAQASFALFDSSGQPVPGRLTLGFWPSIYFLPDSEVLPSGQYEARVAGSLIDRAGNPLGTDLVWRFTVDGEAPALVSTSPASGATRVPIDGPITVTFNDEIGVVGLAQLFADSTDDRSWVSISASVSGRSLILQPWSPLRRGQTYRVKLTSPVTDRLGNQLVGELSWTFTTDPGLFGRFERVLPSTSRAGTTALADMNADGRPDFVWSESGKLMVAQLRADGSTATPLESTLPGASTCPWRPPELADVNGDGRMDAVLVSESCGTQVMLQGADGLLHRADLLPSAHRVQLVDVNGDGRTDVVAMEDGTVLRHWRQAGDGRLVREADIAIGSSTAPAVDFVAGDLNADGRIDFATITDVDHTELKDIHALMQDASGHFSRSRLAALDASSLRSADTDGDGRTDLLLSTSSYDLTILRQRNAGSFSSEPSFKPGGTQMLLFADVDADGRTDLLAANANSPVMVVLRGADGTWQTPMPYETYVDYASMHFADITGDGRADIVLGAGILRGLGGPSEAAARVGVFGVHSIGAAQRSPALRGRIGRP